MPDLKSLPPRPSHYVTSAAYTLLTEDARAWDAVLPPTDPADRAAAESFLYAEARLLDQGRFEEWLDLYASECLYWVPSEAGGGDPAREVAIALDDRRRLEDRVVWLRSAFVWSQIPRSRTVRQISGVETLRDGTDLVVRSVFTLHDVRAGRHAVHAGWYLHRVDTAGGRWRVRAKQVHLAACDQPHDNVSLIF